MKRKFKTFELSFVRDGIQYFESRYGEIMAYTGGPVHKVNFFSVDSKCRLLRSLYFDLSIARIFIGKNNKIILERIVEDEK